MAVIFETSIGDLTIDLFVDDCPQACKNFLKLCKIKYYNNCLFYNVQRNFVAQAGDPLNTGKGGSSINGLLFGEQARFFDDEIRPRLKHSKRGIVGMASARPNQNGSEFYIQLSSFPLDSLDEKHTIFGEVSEGLELLERMNEAAVDAEGRPIQNIRIRHTLVLDDPFEDPQGLDRLIPESSPEPVQNPNDLRIEEDWAPVEDERDPEEIERELKAKEAASRAVVLEMIGDLPDADVKPPPNAVFICKLNPVTTEEDLEIIFSQCGKVTSCDIIRDFKTGDSLCYGFIGFETDAMAEKAYMKMNNVLIDDRRIKVDFSQSVSHIWKQFKKFGRKGGPPELMGGGGRGGGRGEGAGGRGRLELKGAFAQGLNTVPLFLNPRDERGQGAGRGAPREGHRMDRQPAPPRDERRTQDPPRSEPRLAAARDRLDQDRDQETDRDRMRERGRENRDRERDSRSGRERDRGSERNRDVRRRSRSRSRSQERRRNDRSRSFDRERRRNRSRSRSRDRTRRA